MTKLKRKGRPAGSKNFQYADALELPAACPACGSSELRTVPGAKVSEMHTPGRMFDVAYRRIEWHNKVCPCGQRVRVRKFFA